MRSFLVAFLVFFAILLESSVTSIPLALSVLLILYIVKRKSWVFMIAFLAGIFLDIASVRTVGQSSVFFITLLFIVTLYERKFEITSGFFVFFASFFGSFIYLLVFGFDNAFWQAVISSIFSLLLFKTIGVLFVQKDHE